MATKQELKKLKKEIYGNPNWINGRINRLEFIIASVCCGLTSVICLLVGLMILVPAFITFSPIMMAIGAAVMCLALWTYWRMQMACVKRLHDLGWSGWWALILFLWESTSIAERLVKISPAVVTIIGLFLFVMALCLTFIRGDKGPNKYGKDPLMKYEENK